jgi:hypothetical protein
MFMSMPPIRVPATYGSGHQLAGVNGGIEPPEVALVLLGAGL